MTLTKKSSTSTVATSSAVIINIPLNSSAEPSSNPEPWPKQHVARNREIWQRQIQAKKYTGNAKSVGVTLSWHMNGEEGGRAWPSHETLANESGLCTRTVIRSLQDLEAGGDLQIIRSKGPDGKQALNNYFPIFRSPGDNSPGDTRVTRHRVTNRAKPGDKSCKSRVTAVSHNTSIGYAYKDTSIYAASDDAACVQHQSNTQAKRGNRGKEDQTVTSSDNPLFAELTEEKREEFEYYCETCDRMEAELGRELTHVESINVLAEMRGWPFPGVGAEHWKLAEADFRYAAGCIGAELVAPEFAAFKNDWVKIRALGVRLPPEASDWPEMWRNRCRDLGKEMQEKPWRFSGVITSVITGAIGSAITRTTSAASAAVMASSQ